MNFFVLIWSKWYNKSIYRSLLHCFVSHRKVCFLCNRTTSSTDIEVKHVEFGSVFQDYDKSRDIWMGVCRLLCRCWTLWCVITACPPTLWRCSSSHCAERLTWRSSVNPAGRYSVQYHIYGAVLKHVLTSLLLFLSGRVSSWCVKCWELTWVTVPYTPCAVSWRRGTHWLLTTALWLVRESIGYKYNSNDNNSNYILGKNTNIC